MASAKIQGLTPLQSKELIFLYAVSYTVHITLTMNLTDIDAIYIHSFEFFQNNFFTFLTSRVSNTSDSKILLLKGIP